MSITKSIYGKTPGGKDVFAFEIKNNNGTRAVFLSLGATLDKLFVRDKSGAFRDVLLGFDDLTGHLERSDYQGVVVGQFCNRVGGGTFYLDGKQYYLTKNDHGNCLHGGGEYSGALWDAEILDDKSIAFTYFSPDMTNGFPGNVTASVTYTLTDRDEIVMDYRATTDRNTVINLTNHAYFNLNGFNGGTILDHELTLFCDRFTPIDETLIPTGELSPVKGTPFSFIEGKKIGRDIAADKEQLRFGGGYDHNFCITDSDGTLRKAAVVTSPQSGIVLTVSTTLPGVQLYTGNLLNGTAGKQGLPMNRRTGFCLETQLYPDTPNKPGFPSAVFTPERPYTSTTVFRFSTI